MFAARNNPEPGEQRMEIYRAACILWWAMIEAPGIVADIGFILYRTTLRFLLWLYFIC